jgi:hypothetical protein
MQQRDENMRNEAQEAQTAGQHFKELSRYFKFLRHYASNFRSGIQYYKILRKTFARDRAGCLAELHVSTYLKHALLMVL